MSRKSHNLGSGKPINVERRENIYTLDTEGKAEIKGNVLRLRWNEQMDMHQSELH